MELLDELSALSRAVSVHGEEGELARLLGWRWSMWLDEWRQDRLGNFIGLVRGSGPGPRPRVLAAAHLDGVGLMVTRIEEGGFLRVTAVGGADRRHLLGQQVEVRGRRRLTGIIGAKPPHLTTPEERKTLPPFEELYVDLGLPEDEVREAVPPGTAVLCRQEVSALRNGRVAGSHLDNTAGLAVMGLAVRELFRLRDAPGRRKLAGLREEAGFPDFYAVGTVGEETGRFPGATAAAFGLEPDIAIAVDVTYGALPGEDDPTGTFALESGPTVGIGPNCHPGLTTFLRETAAGAGIALGLEVLPGNSGTDAWVMQTARGGIPTAVLSVPLRYMHTPVETVSLADLRDAGRLLALAAAGFTPELARSVTSQW
ncbi:MAG: M42 family peptidase [Bacillota bacterium]